VIQERAEDCIGPRWALALLTATAARHPAINVTTSMAVNGAFFRVFLHQSLSPLSGFVIK